ncbi:ketopantoate reductase family protein [Amnibacterium flavum]|uniref:2-dehydropantoate 2-reductase n=1 Tax=Amnibacterium flavum TaxID=2173173 RepID=A0A2V1HMF0_9MICO|nr:2-dehydropantoate 2-reductase [Amnibacterium flavum]PVZ93635.1 2-dehydropantoate 2-reductase [Amnibacterium flavum]
MRIGVVGAGAIGGTLAALLDRAGHEVTVSVRGPALEIIAERGIRLTGGWGHHTAHVSVGAHLGTRQDLTIFATKAPDLDDAVAANRSAIGDSVLVVRNGLGARAAVQRMLGDDAAHVFGGLAVFAATTDGEGAIRVTSPGPLYLGGGDGLGELVDVLRQALPTVELADLEGAEWSKLLVNQVNALPAITGLSVQETIADPKLRRVLVRSMREAIGIARANGVRFAELQGLSDRLLRVIRAAPLPVAELLPRRMAKRMGSVPNQGSTLQSIRRGRPTEVDWLNGAVVEAAAAAGRTAPINAALVAMVHEVEKTGSFLTADDVAARV